MVIRDDVLKISILQIYTYNPYSQEVTACFFDYLRCIRVFMQILIPYAGPDGPNAFKPPHAPPPAPMGKAVREIVSK